MTPAARTSQLDRAFAALADPTRRAILARLATGEAAVTELAEPFDMTLPAVLKHLKVLEAAGLIARSRESRWRLCRLEAEPLRELSLWLEPYRRLSEAFDHFDVYLARLQDREPGPIPRTFEEQPPPNGQWLGTRVIDAPRELVFHALTSPEHVVHCLGPPGFTTPVCEMDVRVGGKYRFISRDPTTGIEYPFRGEYQVVVPPERLVYTQVYDVEPWSDRETVIKMTLTDTPDGRTLLRNEAGSIADTRWRRAVIARGQGRS